MNFSTTHESVLVGNKNDTKMRRCTKNMYLLQADLTAFGLQICIKLQNIRQVPLTRVSLNFFVCIQGVDLIDTNLEIKFGGAGPA